MDYEFEEQEEQEIQSDRLSPSTKKKVSIITFIVGVVLLLGVVFICGRVLNKKSTQPNDLSAQLTQPTQVNDLYSQTQSQTTQTNDLSTQTQSQPIQTTNLSIPTSNEIEVLKGSNLDILLNTQLTTTYNGTFIPTNIKTVLKGETGALQVVSTVEGQIEGITGTFTVELPHSFIGHIVLGNRYNITYSSIMQDNQVYIGNIVFN